MFTPEEFSDPGNSASYLRNKGWKQTSQDPERWIGMVHSYPDSYAVGVERTASGRVKCFILDPPDRLRRRAHNDRCLLKPSNVRKGTVEVHFAQEPETFADGIAEMRELLNPAFSRKYESYLRG